MAPVIDLAARLDAAAPAPAAPPPPPAWCPPDVQRQRRERDRESSNAVLIARIKSGTYDGQRW